MEEGAGLKTTIDPGVQDMHGAAGEMHLACKFILKRLNQLTAQQHTCSCTEQLKQTQLEVSKLTQTLVRLQKEESNRSVTMAALETQLDELMARHVSLQTQMSATVNPKLSMAPGEGLKEDIETVLVGLDVNKAENELAECNESVFREKTHDRQEDNVNYLEPIDNETSSKSFPNSKVNLDLGESNFFMYDNENEGKNKSKEESFSEDPDVLHNASNGRCGVDDELADRDTSIPTGVDPIYNLKELPEITTISSLRTIDNETNSAGRSSPVSEYSILVTKGTQDIGSENATFASKDLDTNKESAPYIQNEESSGSEPTSTGKQSHTTVLTYLPTLNPNAVESGKSQYNVGVEQQLVSTHIAIGEWEARASDELDIARTTDIKHLGGAHTVVLLDISESMQHGWTEVKTFFYDFISGLDQIREQYGVKDDHVAMVTFGHETTVKLRLTNNYQRHLQLFDSLRVGGPSSVVGGLRMAMAVTGSSDRRIAHIGSIDVRSRIILISDGHFSDPTQETGPDIPLVDPVAVGKMQDCLLETMGTTNKFNIEMVFVPVGEANMENFQLIQSVTEGTLVTYTDGERLARRTLLTMAADPFSLGPAKELPTALSKMDQEDIAAIEEKVRLSLDNKSSRRECTYQERDGDAFPAPGSRVRRGPDWKYGHDKDRLIHGTVVGHVLDAAYVWVNWDTDYDPTPYRYRYGEGGAFDVLPVDEPVRLPPDKLLAVGCFVEPGPGWREEFKPTTPGSVLKLSVDEQNMPKALVRWSRTKRGNYTYLYTGDDDRLPEIFVCSINRAEQPIDVSANTRAEIPILNTAGYRKKNKNKNPK